MAPFFYKWGSIWGWNRFLPELCTDRKSRRLIGRTTDSPNCSRTAGEERIKDDTNDANKIRRSTRRNLFRATIYLKKKPHNRNEGTALSSMHLETRRILTNNATSFWSVGEDLHSSYWVRWLGIASRSYSDVHMTFQKKGKTFTTSRRALKPKSSDAILILTENLGLSKWISTVWRLKLSRNWTSRISETWSFLTFDCQKPSSVHSLSKFYYVSIFSCLTI